MEVGSSSLPGTTHRRKAMCPRHVEGAWDYRGSSESGLVATRESGGLAQLARAPALQAGGQRFESVILHQEGLRGPVEIFDMLYKQDCS